MKRYRVLEMDFDSRPILLGEEIKSSWSQEIQDQWKGNQERIKASLLAEYGNLHSGRKLKDFVDFGVIPFSILSYHNRLFGQARAAFVAGAYYPALTGICALGERILNHLVLELREDHRHTPEYKKVYRNESFNKWTLLINTLESWGVLVPQAVQAFRKLEIARHESLHFRPGVAENDRQFALQAAELLREILNAQFPGLGSQPWFMKGTPGESFLTLDATGMPFVRRFYVPRCRLVGPWHTLSFDAKGRFTIHDDHEYEDTEISDEEFRRLRRVGKAG